MLTFDTCFILFVNGFLICFRMSIPYPQFKPRRLVCFYVKGSKGGKREKRIRVSILTTPPSRPSGLTKRPVLLTPFSGDISFVHSSLGQQQKERKRKTKKRKFDTQVSTLAQCRRYHIV